ncbi:hypothetical protein AAJCM20276_27060 [Acetobacter aceti]|uniref:DUF1902 domain-containing protein n=1 Tax=Acetobacter aceti TaxID=435 RepID=A0A6S6PTN3_ACEAC|nr:DUF1902 domain-containing protein [Acetobacter aceti]BCI68070.1 hypothetical protein AAJCM20276_26940 [Acetobacter aceti]BCI68082.1 hypothetical protein AAJCM20276_27060 [Acetobacter aceti]
MSAISLMEEHMVVHVLAVWDDEAKVFVATSDDVPGLVTEAESLDELKRKLTILIPELMELNGAGEEDFRSVPYELTARSREVACVH